MKACTCFVFPGLGSVLVESLESLLPLNELHVGLVHQLHRGVQACFIQMLEAFLAFLFDLGATERMVADCNAVLVAKGLT
jgi:hypothetical protein